MSPKKESRLRRARRTRAKIAELGTHRLSVHRTPSHIYAQVIAGDVGKTVVAASTVEKVVAEGLSATGNVEAAKKVGATIAERAKAAGITKVAFDRSGFHEYYDPLTTGDSTLSAVVQAILAAEVGYQDLALEYFRESIFVDLGDLHQAFSEPRSSARRRISRNSSGTSSLTTSSNIWRSRTPIACWRRRASSSAAEARRLSGKGRCSIMSSAPRSREDRPLWCSLSSLNALVPLRFPVPGRQDAKNLDRWEPVPCDGVRLHDGAWSGDLPPAPRCQVKTATREGSPLSLLARLAPHLPYVRRYARALTGDQTTGDHYVRVALEALAAGERTLEANLTPRVALYHVFHAIWCTSGAQLEDRTPSDGLEASQRLMRIAPRSRQAFLLTALEGFTPSEASQILDTDFAEDAGIAAGDGGAGGVGVVRDARAGGGRNGRGRERGPRADVQRADGAGRGGHDCADAKQRGRHDAHADAAGGPVR